MIQHSSRINIPKKLISSEQLAYWYMRLNGFLTIPNFVVHPDTRGSQRTDVDVLGIRFPYRAELLLDPMIDETKFIRFKKKPLILIAEVKRDLCSLNGPWTRSEDKNIHRVLRAIGAFSLDQNNRVAESLYKEGVFSNKSYHVLLCCFGSRHNADVKYPSVPQILWDEVLKFIFNRFTEYKRQKANHPQWDDAGKNLWDLTDLMRSEQEFIDHITIN